MKLQRYEIRALDDWGGRIHRQPSDAGQWCAAAHVEQLKAENAALHAECDRLTGMLGPQKVLSAEEVTQPGFYWHRYEIEELCVVDVDYGYPYGQMFIWVNGEQEEYALEGQFIGP